MKKIINGKLYNTETAVKLTSWENMLDARNFSHYTEYLFRKKTGEYFLHGVGGPASKYAEQVEQNCWSGGEMIIPLTVKAAKEWAEEHLDGNEYESIFGSVNEDDEDRLINFMISASLDKKLSDKAAELGTSKSDVLRKLIEQME